MAEKLVPLNKSLIKPDTPLRFPVYRDDGFLLAQRGMVLTEDQAERLLQYEQLMTEPMSKSGSGKDQRIAAFDSQDRPSHRLPTPFERLVHVENDLLGVFTHPMLIDNLARIESMLNRLEQVCQMAPDVAIAKIFLDDKISYSVQHSVHTAILCELIATYLKWSDADRRALGAAALTMNISTQFLQDKLQGQSEPLEEWQKSLIDEHPKQSADILRELGVKDAKWLAFVEKHHERPDGKGYPSGLSGDQVPLGASIIHLADVYCAKITGRSYRQPILPNVAARDIFLVKGQQAEETATEILVKILGMYPPGCLVRLVNGEIAMVIKRGARLNEPQVRSLVDASGKPIRTPQLLNTQNKAFAVKRLEDPRQVIVDYDVDVLWGYSK